MPVLSDFRCPQCRTVTESWTSTRGVAPLSCPACGHSPLTRLIGGTHLDYIGMATDGVQSSDGMNTTIDKWDKMRQKQMRIEKRNQERHGDYY